MIAAVTTIIKGLIDIFCAVIILISSFTPGAVKANEVPAIADGADVRIVSFNLRCVGTGNTSVAYRQSLLITQLLEVDADSMGFQEANIEWLTLLKEGLKDYDYVGRTRFDGNFLGEASPVFYKKDKYNLLDSGTFWLSKTPDRVGSKDWGSQNIRVCTYALLENKETGLTYVHMNTHLDHISSLARENQMQVILDRMQNYINEYPVVLTGDFNDGVGSVTYKKATGVFTDARVAAPVTDNTPTYHGYGVTKSLIDFVFINDKVEPLVYHVIDDKLKDVYLSDHYGIYSDLKING